MQSYTDTVEDYTASLYYNLTGQSVIYYEGNQSPLTGNTYSGNPNASGTYNYSNPVSGLYTEVTDHYVDLYYVASAGSYYDPYGFSVVQSDPSGDYNSGWWFSVFVYGTYIAEQSVLLGTSYESTNFNNGYGLTPGPSLATVLYQAFIPPDYVFGPPIDARCLKSVYAGDNRGLNPAGGSYRAFQQIAVGIGGLNVSLTPVQDTGFTYQFSASVPQNGVIPNSAYNFYYIGQCSSKGVHEFGKASKALMIAPPVSYPSATQTVTHFTGKVTNPVPLIAIPISWDISVNLTETSRYAMVVSGYYDVDCYPAHELSVANFDVFSFVPTDNSIFNITFCLSGVNSEQGSYSANVPM